MEARMQNPASLVPGSFEAIQALIGAIQKSRKLPATTLHLVHLRASQINGCAACIDGGVRHAKKEGETDQRLHAVAGWFDAPYFTDAERAALALTEAVTRMGDRSDPVPDAIWNEVTKHFDEAARATLVLWIATTNLFNRINVTTRQVAGSW
jgi:AhpD family alkylhydroperoxidase